jgi:hypothetical protein
MIWIAMFVGLLDDFKDEISWFLLIAAAGPLLIGYAIGMPSAFRNGCARAAVTFSALIAPLAVAGCSLHAFATDETDDIPLFKATIALTGCGMVMIHAMATHRRLGALLTACVIAIFVGSVAFFAWMGRGLQAMFWSCDAVALGYAVMLFSTASRMATTLRGADRLSLYGFFALAPLLAWTGFVALML